MVSSYRSGIIRLSRPFDHIDIVTGCHVKWNVFKLTTLIIKSNVVAIQSPLIIIQTIKSKGYLI